MDGNIIDLDAKRKERQKHTLQMGARLMVMVDEARKHPLGLYRLCFTDDFGEAITLKWFHREWAEMLLTNTHAMIEAPRGSSKTTFLIALSLWMIGHNPNIRIGIICGNDANAAKRLGEIKSHIQNDPLYKLVFPNIQLDEKLKNDSMNLNVVRERHSRDYTVEARGVISDGTGDRKDLLLFDDVCNYKNTIHEPASRPKVLQKVRGDWLNTLNPRGGRAWFIFTPWHNEDCHAIFKKTNKGRWAYKRYHHGKPGDPFHSIFPELFSRTWLKRKRKELGNLEYARAYLCKALSSDVQIVRSEWLRPYNRYDITAPLLNRATVILSIDPTGSKGSKQNSKDPDYIGVSVLLTDTSPESHNRPTTKHRIYVVESYQLRLSTANAARHIYELHSKWKPDAVVIEAQGAQSLHEWVIEQYSHIPVVPMPATLSKQQRLESITPWLQDPAQKVLFHPRTVNPDPQEFNVTIAGKSPITTTAKHTLRSQLLDFPTTHDDVVDSLVQGLRYIRHYVLGIDADQIDPEAQAGEVDVSIRTCSI